MTPISPHDDDLKATLVTLKSENPTLGIAKLHALLLSTNPSWTVSEKRLRKILQSDPVAFGVKKKPEEIYPSSKVIEGLDVTKWTTKVEVKYFDKIKGKGLIAKEKIAEGETIWKEDHFVLAPEWALFDLQRSSRVCEYCTTPLGNSSLVVPCSSSPCPARFCNRLCLSRSAKTHPLLCPTRNPASAPLIAFARNHEWLALHSLAQCTSRVLLANQQGDNVLEADWRVVQSFAELGMEERFLSVDLQGVEPDHETWQRAHKLLLEAFRDPPSAADKKKLDRILKRPLREDVTRELFDYNAFLRGLGRMSLNLEAHGGLYTLHAHLNHSCVPNVSVRHIDQNTTLSRITLLAKRDIAPGEELVVTYVRPDASLAERRNSLMSWGFGICRCSLCTEQEEAAKASGEEKLEIGDLERELRAGLGVM